MTTRGALALLLAAACGWAEPTDGADWERMREQERYDPYEESQFYADELVMRHPPAGTVPRGRIGAPAVATGTVDGTPVAEVPITVTDELLAVGRTRYLIFCAACHGDGGYGGSIVALNMWPHRPPSLRSGPVAAQPPGHLFRVITDGVGRMPSYASELPVLERWAIVAYVQTLQRRANALPSEIADSVRAATFRDTELRVAPGMTDLGPLERVLRATTPVPVPEEPARP